MFIPLAPHTCPRTLPSAPARRRGLSQAVGAPPGPHTLLYVRLQLFRGLDVAQGVVGGCMRCVAHFCLTSYGSPNATCAWHAANSCSISLIRSSSGCFACMAFIFCCVWCLASACNVSTRSNSWPICSPQHTAGGQSVGAASQDVAIGVTARHVMHKINAISVLLMAYASYYSTSLFFLLPYTVFVLCSLLIRCSSPSSFVWLPISHHSVMPPHVLTWKSSVSSWLMTESSVFSLLFFMSTDKLRIFASDHSVRTVARPSALAFSFHNNTILLRASATSSATMGIRARARRLSLL